jgi:MFS family permease
MKRSLALLCVAQFMVVLDVTIVAVALPSIRAALHTGAAEVEWVVCAYTLAFGGLLVPAGRLADAVGRRRSLVAGLALFTASSLACGLAGAPGVLIAARAVQGAGAALVAPSALALLTATFAPGPPRARALAAWTAAAAAGGASGWVLGGLLAGGPGWSWVFLANVVPGALAVALVPRALPESRRAGRGSLRIAAGLALTATLGLLVLALTRVEQHAPFALPVAGAALAAALFATLERRAARPLLPPALRRSRAFGAAAGAALAITASTSPAMLLAVVYQRDVLGRSALETGVGCLPFNAAVIAGSLAGPRIVARLGERRTMAGGLAAIAAGTALVALVAATRGAAALIPAIVVMGLGLGCASVASTAAGTAALGGEDAGVASGVLNAAAQIGTALGVALLFTLAAARGGAGGDATGQGAAAALAGAAALVLAGPRKLRRPWRPRPSP